MISYARNDPGHLDAVRLLWYLLRDAGVDARLDRSVNERLDWDRWMRDEIDRADFVIVVGSAAYARRADRPPGPEGLGVQAEVEMLRGRLYRERALWEPRVLPVLLPGHTVRDLPSFLSAPMIRYFPLEELTPRGIEELLRVIHDRPGDPPPPLGPVPDLSPLPPPAGRPPVDEGTHRRIQVQYLEWAVTAWRMIDLGDLGAEDETRDDRISLLPLNRMYISLKADPRTLATRRLIKEVADRTQSEVGVRVPGAPDADELVGPDSDLGVAVETAYAENSLLVILGHPGSGKSVVCQWLGWRAANDGLQSAGAPGPIAAPLPMRVRIADYAEFNLRRLDAGEPPAGLTEYLAAASAAPSGIDRGRLADVFARVVEDGRAVLLLDGLDEVIQHREQILETVAGQVNAMAAGNRVIITSRIFGYDEAFLPIDGAVHYVIREMTDEQTAAFVGNFFTAIGAREDAVRLRQHLSVRRSAIRRLARTPLLLASICSYWHRHHQLPADRNRLYRQLILDMGKRWRRLDTVARAATGGAPAAELARVLGDDDVVLTVLAHVAKTIHEGYPSGRIPETDLVEAMEEALFGVRRLGQVDTRSLGPTLVAVVRSRIGILAEVEYRRYGFLHQTFREYLLGLTLLPPGDLGAAERAQRTVAAMTPHLEDPRWREPLIAVLGEGDPAARLAVLRHLVERADSGFADDWADLAITYAVRLPAVPRQQLDLILKIAFRSYREIYVNRPQLLPELQRLLADLRSADDPERFDDVAVALLPEPEGMAVAHLFHHRCWLTTTVLTAFGGAAHLDEEAWGWPIHRGLRRAAQAVIAPELTIVPELTTAPGTTTDDAVVDPQRLHELGARAWAERRDVILDRSIDEVPEGVLPLRDAFGHDALRIYPTRWRAATADVPRAAALFAMFGGLDHRDTPRRVRDRAELSRLLTLPEGRRRQAIEARAADLVPRFGIARLEKAIEAHLQTEDAWDPEPAARPEWLAAPSAAAVAAAVSDWAEWHPGDPSRLVACLDQIASASRDADRAAAELGLLILGRRRHLTPDEHSMWELARALDAVGDAALRAVHHYWLAAIWEPANGLTEAERAALHRIVLDLTCAVAGQPLDIGPALDDLQPEGHAAPVLLADFAGRWLLGLRTEVFTARSRVRDARPAAIAEMARWLTLLPAARYRRLSNVSASWLERDDRAPQDRRSTVQRALDWMREAGQDPPAEFRDALNGVTGPPPDDPPDAPADAVVRKLFDRIGQGVPLPSRAALLACLTIVNELRHQLASGTAATRVAGQRSLRRMELGPAVIAEVDALLSAGGGNDERVARLLSAVERVDPDAVPWLERLARSGWQAAEDLLVLHRTTPDRIDLAGMRQLVELAEHGDAPTSAKAFLRLCGPYSAANRPDRRYQLSRTGGELLRQVAAESMSAQRFHRTLLLNALQEWAVDTRQGLIDMAPRSPGDPSAGPWCCLLQNTTLWEPAAQVALAEWLDGVPPDPRFTDVALSTAAMVTALADKTKVEIQGALVAALTKAAEAAPGSARMIFRAGAAVHRLECGHEVMAAVREAADDRALVLPGVLARYEARAVPVIRGRDRTDARSALASYGALHFSMTNHESSHVGQYVPSGWHGDVRLLEILLAWLEKLHGEAGRPPARDQPFDYATHEAVICLLAVLAERNLPAYRARCHPRRMQPLLMAASYSESNLVRSAALVLLGRLSYVDADLTGPAELIAVFEAALRERPRTQHAALGFMRSVPYVHGASLADELITRIHTTTNETVRLGMATLARAYLDGPACTTAEARRLRQALRAAASAPGRRYSVLMIGSGAVNDPLDWEWAEDVGIEIYRLLRRRPD